MRQEINSVAQRYQQNKSVQDMMAASTAFAAAKKTLEAIKPDGTYVPDAGIPKQLDYNLMVNYAKILDPTSVVREGEIALLKGTSSAWGRLNDIKTGADFQNYVQAITGQTMFTNKERRSMADLLTTAYQNRVDAVKPLRAASEAQLRQIGADQTQIDEALPFHVLPGGSAKPAASVPDITKLPITTIPGKGRGYFDAATDRFYPIK